MKVVNKTQYETADLKRLFQRIARDELESWQRKRIRVTVCYMHSRRKRLRTASDGRTFRYDVSGVASIGGCRCVIRLPRLRAGEEADTPSVALIVAHEFAHLRGVKHDKTRRNPHYDWAGPWREIYAWANDYPLRLRAPKPAKPKPTKEAVVADKLAHAAAMLKRNTAKLRKYTTIARNWRRRVKYYERQLAVAAAKPPEERNG